MAKFVQKDDADLTERSEGLLGITGRLWAFKNTYPEGSQPSFNAGEDELLKKVAASYDLLSLTIIGYDGSHITPSLCYSHSLVLPHSLYFASHPLI